MIDPLVLASISIVVLFAMILAGVHIGVALASVSVVGIWGITGKLRVAISLLETTAYSAVMDYIFAVIPLFVLMGLLASLSGSTTELFSSAQIFLGRIRGGLGIATVFANAVFAAITGVSVASAAVFSKIAIPEMERLEYDRKFGLGIVAGSAILGMLIPPSILMIVYGVLTEESIGRLFIAGIIPGFLVTGVLILGIWIMVTLRPEIGGKIEKAGRLDLKTMILTVVKPWGVVALIVLVLGGIYGGFFTPTEAGAIGASGAFLLVILKRKFTLKGFWGVLMASGQTTASIFLLLITAQMYSRMLTLSGLASTLSEWTAALTVPPIIIILSFVLIMFFLGMVLDSVSILLLTIPIMFPIILKLGYDPIWFGIVAIVAIEIGLLTPPFGMVIFSMKSALGADVRIEEIFLGSIPFVFMLLFSLIILIVFPSLSTWLPSLM